MSLSFGKPFAGTQTTVSTGSQFQSDTINATASGSTWTVGGRSTIGGSGSLDTSFSGSGTDTKIMDNGLEVNGNASADGGSGWSWNDNASLEQGGMSAGPAHAESYSTGSSAYSGSGTRTTNNTATSTTGTSLTSAVTTSSSESLSEGGSTAASHSVSGHWDFTTDDAWRLITLTTDSSSSGNMSFAYSHSLACDSVTDFGTADNGGHDVEQSIHTVSLNESSNWNSSRHQVESPKGAGTVNITGTAKNFQQSDGSASTSSFVRNRFVILDSRTRFGDGLSRRHVVHDYRQLAGPGLRLAKNNQ